ncbi:DUF4145 domain-containing protein [Alienimonas californiensis]|nr:DUF4145 domain-containing protein [Alienimonas californiensis]
MWGHDAYQIVQCQGCESVTFRHSGWFSEDREVVTRLYPHRSEDNVQAKDFYNVPQKIRAVYQEAVDCFNQQMVILCAAGLRAVVDGICAEKGIKKGPVLVQQKDGSFSSAQRSGLDGKIGGLAEKNFISSATAAALHEHRFLGNDAVHKLDAPGVHDLRIAIKLLENVMESLYEMPDMVEHLRTARERKAATAKRNKS